MTPPETPQPPALQVKEDQPSFSYAPVRSMMAGNDIIDITQWSLSGSNDLRGEAYLRLVCDEDYRLFCVKSSERACRFACIHVSFTNTNAHRCTHVLPETTNRLRKIQNKIIVEMNRAQIFLQVTECGWKFLNLIRNHNIMIPGKCARKCLYARVNNITL